MANTRADDGQFVVAQYNYLHGRNPTAAELTQAVDQLQGGMTRDRWSAVAEKYGNEEADVTRIFRQTIGRDPTPQEVSDMANGLRNGTTNRKDLTTYLQGKPEALLKPPAAPGTTPGQENAKDYMNDTLRQYGLDGLSDWAWNEIQAGNSTDRVLQDLRKTDQYQQRFKGMALRQAAGLPAISEGQYIQYETAVRQMMRAAGLPSDFYDSPNDFANFIGKDVSISEMQSRINDGYLAASNASTEVKQQLQSLYGVSQGQLAAYFLDPDKALPLIQRQWAAAQDSGAAVQAGYGALNQTEAERLASLGVSGTQAAQGFSTLVGSQQLFQNLPGETGDLISRQQQQDAMFANNATDRQLIVKRGEQRVSEGSGASAFALGNQGVTSLSQEMK